MEHSKFHTKLRITQFTWLVDFRTFLNSFSLLVRIHPIVLCLCYQLKHQMGSCILSPLGNPNSYKKQIF